MTPVYTIGHSNHSIADFLGLLTDAGITALADVRSVPYSRRFPHFRKADLKTALEEAGIAYVWLGRELGARPDDPACYVDGRADFDRIAASSVFQAGLSRVLAGAGDYRLALMCAEREPLDCHRTILVCRHLKHRGADIRHILADGTVEPHARTEARLVEAMGFGEGDLFVADPVEAAYERRGARMTAARPGD